jgi:holliday junction DNA helicase RuvA
MIAGLRGRVRKADASSLVVSVGPVDVRVSVPTPLALLAQPGAEVELRTYLYVREDQLALYGFESDSALEIFELLLSVSGIGPKAALGVLSALQPEQIRRAILQGDTRTLTTAPGVGARAASRIITDLQSKVTAEPAGAAVGVADGAGAALEALVGMGYPPLDAKRAIDVAETDGSVEQILRSALGYLADRT